MQIKIKPGDRFGKLTVLERAENHVTKGGNSQVCWLCRCDCGNKITLTTSSLKKQKTCGKGKCRGQDLTGKRFGKLVVVDLSDKKTSSNRRMWHCKCDCGNEIDIASNRLGQRMNSCGCWAEEMKQEFIRRTPEFAKSQSNREKQAAINMNRAVSGRKTSRNTSGYTGVSYNKKLGKYCAYIEFKGKQYHLGSFEKVEDAARARKIAESKLFEGFLSWYANERPEQWEKIKAISEKDEEGNEKGRSKRKIGSTDICAICGKKYIVSASRQKYCSVDCQHEAVIKWQRDNRHKRDLKK